MNGRTSRETWAARVRAWKASGLTAGESGRLGGFNGQRLIWWRWRLKNTAKTKRMVAPKPMSLSLVPVRVTASGPADDESAVELATGSHVIHVRRGFDGETLARVLQICRGSP